MEPLSITRGSTTATNDNDDSVFEHKLDFVTAGLPAYLRDHLLTKIALDNTITIVNYVLALNPEIR
jgi:hypothetical protein